MHRISTNVVELYVYYILIMYYYVGYCRTIIILLGEGPEGEVGRGRGPRGRLAGCQLRGVSPRALAARGSRLASPRAPRQGLFKGLTGAVTVTGAAADAVTVAVAVRGSGYVVGCVSRKQRERDSLGFPGNIYQYNSDTYRTLPPAGRILTAGQCPPMSS